MKKATRISAISLLSVIAILAAGCAEPAAISSTPSTAPTPDAAKELNVHFIDIFQGDSILIDLDETEIVIDGGMRDSEATVASYLKEFVDGDIETVIVTHNHYDHTGGLIDVLRSFPVEQVWWNGGTSPNIAFIKLMNLVEEKNLDLREAQRGDTIKAGTLTLDVLHPVKPTDSNENNNSIVLRMPYGNITFLFTGDMELEAEEIILEAGLPIQADILKVAHHGASTSSSPPFIEAVNPETAICQNNEEQLEQITIDTITGAGADLYDNVSRGTIIIKTDGETYSVNTEK